MKVVWQTLLQKLKPPLLKAPRLSKSQVFHSGATYPATFAASALWMSLCPLFPLVTHPHSSAHLGATCSRWGKSSGTSLGHSHTRGCTASLLGPAGRLHTHLHLSRNKTKKCMYVSALNMHHMTRTGHWACKINEEIGDVWDTGNDTVFNTLLRNSRMLFFPLSQVAISI